MAATTHHHPFVQPPSSEEEIAPSLVSPYWEMTDYSKDEEPNDAELCEFLGLDALYPELTMSLPPSLGDDDDGDDDQPNELALPVTTTDTIRKPPPLEQTRSSIGIPNPLITLTSDVSPIQRDDKTCNSPEESWYVPTTSLVVSPSASPCTSSDEASESPPPTSSSSSSSLSSLTSKKRREDGSEELQPKKKQRQTSRKNSKQELDTTTTEEEIQRVRRQRNREHARQSRSRKRMACQSLEAVIPKLRETNDRLRHQIYAILGKESTDQELEERMVLPQKKLVEALNKPEHRIVDETTLDFLQSLRKDAMAFTTQDILVSFG